MHPESVTQFAIGPLLGLAVNGTITILCIITLSFYRKYRPLRSLFLFYFVITLSFLGWLIYGLQKSQEAILLGYRIDYAALAFLPACWAWFICALLDRGTGKLVLVITGISFALATLALFGTGINFFTVPLEPDPISSYIMRPRSEFLRPAIQTYCLGSCLFYLIMIINQISNYNDQRRIYMISVAIGLFFWLVGGTHDTIRAMGISILSDAQILWLASIGLSVFLTIGATLHFRSVEQAALRELAELNSVKGKALDHLSHELKTPLSVIQGNLIILRHKLLSHPSYVNMARSFQVMETQLSRLIHIQNRAEEIIQYNQKLEITPSFREEDLGFSDSSQVLMLYPLARRVLESMEQRSTHRDIHFYLEGSRSDSVVMDNKILEDILEGLLRNAVENTPDEGVIRISWHQESHKEILKVQDFGIGITADNQRHIFDGLFHTCDTDLYTTRRPFDFGAGGSGLNLFLLKIYSRRFNFDLWVQSRRCIYLPRDSDCCPGKVSLCQRCQKLQDCLDSGGSTFCLSFPHIN
jgi:signal transduction histidine kinase